MTAFTQALGVPGSIPQLFVFNSGDWARRGMNTRSGRAAEIPSANGVTNARGLSGLYELLQPEQADAAGLGELVQRLRQASRHCVALDDETLLIPTRFSEGCMLGMDNGHDATSGNSLLIGSEAFGHTGSGGSVGFADPSKRLSLGYTMNRLGNGVLVNERGQSLINATYRTIECMP